MSKLKDLVQFENANSALALRRTPYEMEDRESLLIDVLALANAPVSRSRLLVLGAYDKGGAKRRLKGVDRGALPTLIESYQRTVDDFVEPALNLSMKSVVIQNRTLAIIILRECDNQPYVLSKNVSERLRKGDGWIRRGVNQTRLGRADLKNMFRTQTLTGTMGCELQVVFEGSALSSTLELPVLPVSKKPSELARERIHGLLKAKKAAHERLGKTDTWMDRLALARMHGADQPYETQSPMTLLSQLGQTEKDNEAADRYYEYELRAHKVNFAVVNMGDGPLNSGSVILEIPDIDGVAVAARIYPPVGVPDTDIPEGYPKVELGKGRIQLLAQLGQVGPGMRLTVFRQPIRLMLREPALGKNLPITFKIFGKELRDPITGSLQVSVTDSTERLKAVCK